MHENTLSSLDLPLSIPFGLGLATQKSLSFTAKAIYCAQSTVDVAMMSKRMPTAMALMSEHCFIPQFVSTLEEPYHAMPRDPT
jgi:hypothetical protein